PKRDARAMMARLGRSHESVIRQVKKTDHLTEISRTFLGPVYPFAALLARGLDHLQAVLVGPADEANVLALAALEARDRVPGDRFIRMADVRRGVTVACPTWAGTAIQ